LAPLCWFGVAARDPWLYLSLGVPDTLDGRFDLIALHAFLLVHRLQDEAAPGPDLAQAVFDAMFRDMDNNLREIGVSDLTVGKRVRAMWEAFHGRAKAYAAALEATDRLALETALARNVCPDACWHRRLIWLASHLRFWHRGRCNSCRHWRHHDDSRTAQADRH
jgi:hypothetical protein